MWEDGLILRMPGHYTGQFFPHLFMHILQKSLRQLSHSIGSTKISIIMFNLKNSLDKITYQDIFHSLINL